MTLTLIVVFAIFQVILFLMHAVVYQMLGVAFGWQATWLAWLFAILSITFVNSSVLAHLYSNSLVKAYYKVSMYWFGLVAFLTGASFFFFFISYAFYSFNIYLSPFILGLIFFGGIFLTHTYATWQTTRPKMSWVEIALPHLPEFWRGKKIVFVSDVHLGAVRGEGFAKKVVAKIAAESPDMVLIGGDIFDGVKCHPASLLKPFTTLHPSQGMFFASGNHEYIEDTEILFREIAENKMQILSNEVAEVHGLQIAGVDWKDSHSEAEFKTILGEMQIDVKKPSILIRHEPNHLNVAADGGISLTLCGHTHRGQIFPLRYITHRMYKGFDYGLKKLDKMFVYTSSGVGTWGPPLRFGTKAEIVAITLK